MYCFSGSLRCWKTRRMLCTFPDKRSNEEKRIWVAEIPEGGAFSSDRILPHRHALTFKCGPCTVKVICVKLKQGITMNTSVCKACLDDLQIISTLRQLAPVLAASAINAEFGSGSPWITSTQRQSAAPTKCFFFATIDNRLDPNIVCVLVSVTPCAF